MSRRQLNNKALVVLSLLREEGELTCHAVSDMVMDRTPCAKCAGSGAGGHPRFGCRACYGRGKTLFSYSTAYIALRQLRAHGLVARRRLLDQFGDETQTWVWYAVESAAPVDPLEELFALPAHSATRTTADS